MIDVSLTARRDLRCWLQLARHHVQTSSPIVEPFTADSSQVVYCTVAALQALRTIGLASIQCDAHQMRELQCAVEYLEVLINSKGTKGEFSPAFALYYRPI